MRNYVTIPGARPDSRNGKVANDREFDYLKPKKKAQQSLDALHEAVDEDNLLEEPQRNCHGKDMQFSNYDDPRSIYGVPSDEEARVMCSGCPLFDLCKKYADLERPAWGVWAGKVYGRELLEEEND